MKNKVDKKVSEYMSQLGKKGGKNSWKSRQEKIKKGTIKVAQDKEQVEKL